MMMMTPHIRAVHGGRKSRVGSKGEVPVESLRDWLSFFYNENRICEIKMQINDNFCLKFLSEHTICSLSFVCWPVATLHRDFAKFWTPFCFWTPHFFRFISTFWLDCMLELNYEWYNAIVSCLYKIMVYCSFDYYGSIWLCNLNNSSRCCIYFWCSPIWNGVKIFTTDFLSACFWIFCFSISFLGLHSSSLFYGNV